MRIRAITTITTVAAAALLALSGCTAATSEGVPSPLRQGDSIRIADAWAKAGESGMSAAFGTLENNSSQSVTVVGVDSAASTSIQLHETVENTSGAQVMREKVDGFTIPAKGSLQLAPGGNHLMLMDLAAPIKAGDDVTFTLIMKDGSTYEFTAPAKDYTGANENYEDGGMDGMDMGASTPTDSSTDLGH